MAKKEHWMIARNSRRRARRTKLLIALLVVLGFLLASVITFDLHRLLP